MSRKDWVVGVVASVAGIDTPTAVAVVERLMEEGLLQLGYGNSDVDKIVETFSRTYGTTKTSARDRWAAHRLAEVHTSQAVCGIIQLLASKADDRYAPQPRSVADLEEKWVSVMAFLRKQSDNEPVD